MVHSTFYLLFIRLFVCEVTARGYVGMEAAGERHFADAPKPASTGAERTQYGRILADDGKPKG
jgi:hypothetical protein